MTVGITIRLTYIWPARGRPYAATSVWTKFFRRPELCDRRATALGRANTISSASKWHLFEEKQIYKLVIVRYY